MWPPRRQANAISLFILGGVGRVCFSKSTESVETRCLPIVVNSCLPIEQYQKKLQMHRLRQQEGKNSVLKV